MGSTGISNRLNLSLPNARKSIDFTFGKYYIDITNETKSSGSGQLVRGSGRSQGVLQTSYRVLVQNTESGDVKRKRFNETDNTLSEIKNYIKESMK